MGKQAILTRAAKCSSSMIKFGWSNHLAAHMQMVFERQKFCSFDFGSKELNLKHIGFEEQIDFLAHFDKIDVPITYYVSLEDHLCRPDDVML